MKKIKLLTVALLASSFVIIIPSCLTVQEKAPEKSPIVAEVPKDPIKVGENLVTIMGCNDCHSPKKMGANGPEIIPELMLSGYPSDRPIVHFDDKMIKQGFTCFTPTSPLPQVLGAFHLQAI